MSCMLLGAEKTGRSEMAPFPTEPWPFQDVWAVFTVSFPSHGIFRSRERGAHITVSLLRRSAYILGLWTQIEMTGKKYVPGCMTHPHWPYWIKEYRTWIKKLNLKPSKQTSPIMPQRFCTYWDFCLKVYSLSYLPHSIKSVQMPPHQKGHPNHPVSSSSISRLSLVVFRAVFTIFILYVC